MKCKYLIAIIIIGVICFGGQVFARYILTRNFDVNITTAPFYFEAEIQDTEIELIDNQAEINLTIKNNDGTNYNLYDTSYEISLGTDSKYTFSIESEEVRDNKLTKTMHGGSSINNNFTLKFTPIENASLDLQEDPKLIIKSTKPYSKIIEIPVIIETVKGAKYSTETDIKVGEVPITIPGGTVISAIEGEYENPEDGLVMYIMKDVDEDGITDEPDWTDINMMRTTYDQFVWIPIANPVAESQTELDTMVSQGKYPMALQIDGTDSNGLQNYRGILYNFELSSDGNQVNVTPITYSSTGYREPAYLTNSTNGDANTTNNNVGITSNLLQEEFNAMIDRVKNNKGFWIGRYETSNMVTNKSKDSTNQVKVIKGTKTGVNEMNFYRMYAQQKGYSKLVLGTTTETISSMIWGSQWDQVLIWLKNIENKSKNSYYVINSIGMANHTSNLGGTGELQNTGYYAVKNIYDLAGNLAERTLEAYNTNIRVFRGGSHVTASSQYTMPSYRNTSYNTVKTGDNCGSRLTIY